MTKAEVIKADAEFEAEQIAAIRKLKVGDRVKVLYCSSVISKWERAVVTRIGRKYAYAKSLVGGRGEVSTVGFITFQKI